MLEFTKRSLISLPTFRHTIIFNKTYLLDHRSPFTDIEDKINYLIYLGYY